MGGENQKCLTVGTDLGLEEALTPTCRHGEGVVGYAAKPHAGGDGDHTKRIRLWICSY